MLHLYIGENGKALKYPNNWFMNAFPREFLNTPLAKEIVLGIDKSELESPNAVLSPYLGRVGIDKLSTGARQVLIACFTDKVIDLVHCGDNCLSYIKKRSIDKDIYVTTTRWVNLFDKNDNLNVQVVIDNSGVVVRDFLSYFDEFEKFGSSYS